jgi:NifB/MoaA-like Fe-S oxidoreductase
MSALLRHEFNDAKTQNTRRLRITIATGVAAEPLISELVGDMAQVVAIRNDFFGHTVTVAGLVCGGDLIAQLSGRDLGDELLLPASMLRHERDLFLDGVSIADVEKALGVPVRLVENDGYELLDAISGR